MSTDWMSRTIADVDPDVATALEKERLRQNNNLEMIASENFVSKAVMAAAGSIFTNKYAEGYPGRRYYGGCEQYDIVENLARDRAKQLFGAEHANVQPHSGAQANMAVLMAMVKPGETILGMDLSHGGHLTHGHPLNYSGKTFKVVSYGVTKEHETLDYDALAALAAEHKPRMIICGASAYPRIIDFERIGQIARDNDALCLADIAHIAGLVVAGLHPSPVPHVDFVTTTTHKTLRGPRGGLIMCRESHAKEIDRALFPGVQGGPLMHAVAAKAVAFREALELQFGEYQKQVLLNASALATSLMDNGWRLVSGGTDNHLVLVDVFSKGVTGKVAEKALEHASITVNKNTIPFDTQPPLVASGVRLGTPALTTRGMVEDDMRVIAGFIDRVLSAPDDEAVAASVRADVEELCSRFPLYL